MQRKLLPLVLLLAAKLVTNFACRNKTRLSKSQQANAVAQLRAAAPPPHKALLGGEVVNDDTYKRFLAVQHWDVQKAETTLRQDFEWRKKYKPHALRPKHCDEACSQLAWRVLLKQPKTPRSKHKVNETEASLSTDFRSLRRRLATIAKRKRIAPSQLHPPHTRPPLAQWRYTRHGMPITHVDVRLWHPERYSDKKEVTRHCAYHMEHYVRRMPQKNGRQVQRCCIIMSLKGFRASAVPYVCECIQILRMHYPGRLGVAVLYNVPSYFWPLWPIFKKLFDEEIMSKVHFLDTSVCDVEGVIRWLDSRSFAPFSDADMLV